MREEAENYLWKWEGNGVYRKFPAIIKFGYMIASVISKEAYNFKRIYVGDTRSVFYKKLFFGENMIIS